MRFSICHRSGKEETALYLKMKNMKRTVFAFLILCFLSLWYVEGLHAGAIAGGYDILQVPDSTDVFREITDISKQVERQVVKNADTRINLPAGQSALPISETSQAFTDSVSTTPLPPLSVEIPLVVNDTLRIYKNYLDSIYARKSNGTLLLPRDSIDFNSLRGLTFRDTLFYNPLFLPMIFTGEMLPRDLSFYPVQKENDKDRLISEDQTFAPYLNHLDFVRGVRHDYYIKYPDQLRYSVASFDSIPKTEPDDQVVKETFNPFRELIKTETTYSLQAPGVEGVTIKRRYWIRSGEHSFQFAQNYFSDNWYKGGTNNVNFNTYNVFKANYKRDKVRFNNTLEWRLSVFNAPEDTVRQYRIGNDQLRYYGDFGVDAFLKGWSYSMNMEAKSQAFKAYPANSNNLLSSFFSPLYVNAGVGLKFNYEKASQKVRHRKVKWELALAPISINYKYVMNDSVDVKRYGIEEGRKSQLDIGSTVTSILKYDITRYISWDSRLTYFTSYEKVVSEFENSLNLALSNAFSTKIYVNMRFDDGVPPDSKFKYLQINQTLSFGLNYKW